MSEHKEENIEQMLQNISKSKQIPKDVMKKIYSSVFVNIIMAICIMLYLFFIILGCKNIEQNIYEMDLKVFTAFLFVVTIVFMEIAYKKERRNLAIHSIEILFLAIFSLFFLYFYTTFYNKYKIIVGGLSLAYGFYYIVKSIIVFAIMRNHYLQTMSDVMEILNNKYEEEE